MNLKVDQSEVHSSIVNKLLDSRDNMVTYLNTLDSIMEELAASTEGETFVAYQNEYAECVKEIYLKLNVNLGDFANQLDSICLAFEQADAEANAALS